MSKSVSDIWIQSIFRQDGDATTETNCSDVASSSSSQDVTYQIVINTLVFFTVWGISTVVDPKEFRKSFRKPAIYAGVAFQFLLMPLIGFLTVLIFQDLGVLESIALLILCASPGGSFSNWWCNLFNADLALSVSMTSLSTVASIGMLPLNILIYVQLGFQAIRENEADDPEINFKDLGITLGVVIVGIALGLFTGFKYPQHQNKFNFIGNVAGLASILVGVFASADTCDGVPPWQQPFYPLWIATATPLLVALAGVLILGSCLRLKKPQRVAIALETAYQNTSIALAYTITQGDAGRQAAGVPVIYGGYEAGFFFLFMVGSWKAGWTFAPRKEKILRVMFDNWQPGSENHKRLYPEEYDEDELDEKNEEIQEIKVLDLAEGQKKNKSEDEDTNEDRTSLSIKVDEDIKGDKPEEEPQTSVSL